MRAGRRIPAGSHTHRSHEHAFSRGYNTDYWILGLLVSGIGTIASGVNLVATCVSMRAPGMTMGKVPLFVWMILVTAILILFALPPLTAAQIMLLFDRRLGAHFFDTQAGGSALLWQHLFWFFGHPEVYIMALPAFGIISEVIPVFSRKVIFGYESVAAATVAIGFISFGVWAHHMFAVGLTPGVDAIFSGASFLIAVPTGIKVFNWVATLYGGRLWFATPLYFALGFLSMFVIGGLTGIMLAVAPIDWQATDSYFVVAHFHYVLFGGTLFAIMAGAYYWFPKMTGRMLSERIGRWHFWLQLVGFNLTFGPMQRGRAVGHAAAHLYLSGRTGLGAVERAVDNRGGDPGGVVCRVPVECGRVATPREGGRRRPVERLDARVGYHLAPGAVQLRDDPPRCAAAARCGT